MWKADRASAAPTPGLNIGVPPHSFPAPSGAVPDAGAVLRQLAAWSAERPRSQAPRDPARRNVVALVNALYEVSAETARTSQLPAAGVPLDVSQLMELTWLRAGDITRALHTCFEARLLDDAGHQRALRPGLSASVQFAPDLLVVRPLLAMINWSGVRARLLAHGARLPAALAILRALAAETIGVDAEERGRPVPLTNQELAARTLYERRAATGAIKVLVDAGLLSEDRQPGLGGLALTPLAFRAYSPSELASPPAPMSGTLGTDTRPSAETVATADGRLHLELAGHRVTVGRGIAISVDQDSAMGAVVRIGPLTIRVPTAD